MDRHARRREPRWAGPLDTKPVHVPIVCVRVQFLPRPNVVGVDTMPFPHTASMIDIRALAVTGGSV